MHHFFWYADHPVSEKYRISKDKGLAQLYEVIERRKDIADCLIMIAHGEIINRLPHYVSYKTGCQGHFESHLSNYEGYFFNLEKKTIQFVPQKELDRRLERQKERFFQSEYWGVEGD